MLEKAGEIGTNIKQKTNNNNNENPWSHWDERKKMHSFLHCSGLYFSGNPYFCPLFIYFVDFFGCVYVCVCFFSFFVLTLDAVPDSCSTLNLFLNVVTCTQPFYIQSKWKEFGRFHKRHPFFDKYLQPHFFFFFCSQKNWSHRNEILKQSYFARIHSFFCYSSNSFPSIESFMVELIPSYSRLNFRIANVFHSYYEFHIKNKRYNNVFGSLSNVRSNIEIKF